MHGDSYGISCTYLQECYHHPDVQFTSGNNHQDKQRGVGHNADEWVILFGFQGLKKKVKWGASVASIFSPINEKLFKGFH